jgi:hypothetical protein
VGSGLLVAVGALIGAALSKKAFPLIALLFGGGMALMWALVAYGVSGRTRWALWLGAVLAVFGVLLYSLATMASVETRAGMVQGSAFSTVLGYGQALANACFLVGLILLRRERTRR